MFISTGLSQRANVKTVHYYRPKNHRQLIDLLLSSATDLSIQERMSRDFLIACGDEGTARKVVDELEGIRLSNGDQLLRLDSRGSSIFCQVAYHDAPDENFIYRITG